MKRVLRYPPNGDRAWRSGRVLTRKLSNDRLFVVFERLRWARAIPADCDLLPLRSVLDGQIRRVERQAKQQPVVEAPVAAGALGQSPGSLAAVAVEV